MPNFVELSIVMPCLNEAETIATCIIKAKTFLENNLISGEIIIGDNGSTDGSQQIALNLGAVVVNVEEKGYGSATLGAIHKAKGKYIITADTDDSHDLKHLMPFLDKLRQGYDMVMGNRFKGQKIPGAMSFLHRHIGNPILTGIGNLFFRTNVGDFHCGLRGFTKAAFNKMDLQTTGMEFASEIVVKASLNNLRITEVPTTVFPAGRSRKPHLRSFPDGWRHLRFLLLYSPTWLFLVPGIIFIALGLILSLALILFSPLTVNNITFDIHTLLYTSASILIGFQFFTFYALTKIYAIEHGLFPSSKRYKKIFNYINLEVGLITGGICLLFGAILSFYGLSVWANSDFSTLDPAKTLRLTIPAVFSILLGMQIVFFSLFFSILGLKQKKTALI
ncbi:glycosyltransferase family 2 protein [Mangrovimonas aestuarii]|uniref:glycosyltransferase family 2 protein n=1 Tax=Mangrovimonas aestuarii TaxID=3018443 RepID=UPI002379735D|nr:glycosyltransferase family 2 protein [Mangrovimonas aestuarii]